MPIDAKDMGDHDRFAVNGPVIPEEVVATIDALYRTHAHRLAIWDLTRASLSGFQADTFGAVARKGEDYADIRGPNARTAFLVASERDALVMRAFVARAEMESRIRFAVFRDVETMRDWLHAQ